VENTLLFFLVIGTSGVALGLAFFGMYCLNKDADQGDR
jgi:hypothetical protein